MKRVMLICILLAAAVCLMAGMQKEIKQAECWSTFLGCNKGAVDYLGLEYSQPWIYGVTGFAFMINMFPGVCPSGPTAFDSNILKTNAAALGLQFNSINFNSREPDFVQKQQQALEFVSNAIDKGQPVFGWEMALPEYYLITGTTDSSYNYNDYDGTSKECLWNVPGSSEIGMVEMNALSVSKRPLDTRGQVRSALAFVQAYTTDPAHYAVPGYTQGIQAYDVWIKGMNSADRNPLGVCYNAMVWAEARSMAVLFLQEIRTRLGNDYDFAQLDKAIAYYSKTSQALNTICINYGFPPDQSKFTSQNTRLTITQLKIAKQNEAKGIKALLKFARQM